MQVRDVGGITCHVSRAAATENETFCMCMHISSQLFVQTRASSSFDEHNFSCVAYFSGQRSCNFGDPKTGPTSGESLFSLQFFYSLEINYNKAYCHRFCFWTCFWGHIYSAPYKQHVYPLTCTYESWCIFRHVFRRTSGSWWQWQLVCCSHVIHYCSYSPELDVFVF